MMEPIVVFGMSMFILLGSLPLTFSSVAGRCGIRYNSGGLTSKALPYVYRSCRAPSPGYSSARSLFPWRSQHGCCHTSYSDRSCRKGRA